MLNGARRYRKALRVRLPKTSRSHTIRGLLYAQTGRFRRARGEFALALTLDTGNDLAKRAILNCGKRVLLP
jgi:Flp pilus assembly protein TadD